MTQHRSTSQMSSGSGLDTRSDRDPGTFGSPQRSARSRLRWRVLDLVVLAVLAAACGVIFWAWSALGYPPSQACLLYTSPSPRDS